MTIKNINSKNDIRALIKDIILSQTSPFRRQDIIDLAKEYIRGSEFIPDENELEGITDNILDILYRSARISRRKGRYIPNPDNQPSKE